EFVLFLIIQIICTILSNIYISIKADKLFPFLKEYKKEKLDRKSLKSISKNVLAMAFHKLGSVVVSGTDNILISKYIGVIVTGYYSNYLLLTTTLKALYSQFLTSITASVGNLVNTKSDNEVYEFYKKLFFLNAYIAILFTTCLAVLANPFIELLWGRDYLFSNQIVILIMFVFFINCMRQVCNIFIDTNGLFWQIKWKSLFEAIINLVAAIIFVGPLDMGIAGIVLGTVVSCILTNFWWEPYVVYRHALKKPLYQYFILYSKYSFVLFISVLVIHIVLSVLTLEINEWINFVVMCILSVVVPNIIIWLFYRKTNEYKYIVSIVFKMLLKLKLLNNKRRMLN
uniref:lipopolysaccharide biosynthesis protein n=1 Tax=Paenibacillus glycanilyticus TaxID=126569 RepID=UPI003570966C